MSGPCLTCTGQPAAPGQQEEGYEDGICDVCRILSKKDTSIKQVRYCESCQANICRGCENRFDRRIIAAVIQAWQSKFGKK